MCCASCHTERTLYGHALNAILFSPSPPRLKRKKKPDTNERKVPEPLEHVPSLSLPPDTQDMSETELPEHPPHFPLNPEKKKCKMGIKKKTLYIQTPNEIPNRPGPLALLV